MTVIGAVFLVSCIAVAYAGEIYPKTTHPLLLSHNNAGLSSSYTFRFLSETPLSSGMRVKILFPAPQYSAGVGMQPCRAYFSPLHVLPCHAVNETVVVQLGDYTPELSEKVYSLTLANVTNPIVAGTTSHFAMETYSGGKSIDFTDIFCQIAIAPPPVAMATPTVSCLPHCRTGDAANYRISFTTATAVNSRQRVVIEYPAGFHCTGRCSAPGFPSLTCEFAEDRALISGLGTEVLKETLISLDFPQVRNPLSAGFYGPFTVVVFEEFANTAAARSVGVAGTVIAAGDLSIGKVCPNAEAMYCPTNQPHLTPGTLVGFEISGRVANDIPEAGALVIEFSQEFGDVTACRTVSGLKNAECVGQGRKAVFRGALQKGDFVVQARAAGPATTGSLLLATYSDPELIAVIDRVAEPIKIRSERTRRMSHLTVLWSRTPRAGQTAKLSLIFQPQQNFTEIGNGRIRVRLPADASVRFTGSPTIDICGYSLEQTSLSPTFNGGLIDIPLVRGPTVIPNSCTSSIDVTAAGTDLYLPKAPGEYPLEVILMDGIMDLETEVHWFAVKAEVFPSGEALSLVQEAGAETVVLVTFRVKSPAQRVDVELEFEHWSGDLGTGIRNNSSISCIEKGLKHQPLNCSLRHSSPPSLPTILVEGLTEVPADASISLEIAGIKNPVKVGYSPYISVAAFTVDSNGTRLPLHSDSFQLPELKETSPVQHQVHTANITLGTTALETITNTSFFAVFQSQITATSRLVVRFPGGFGFDSIKCRVNEKLCACDGFASASLAVLEITEVIASNTSFAVEIEGLVTPKHAVDGPSLEVDLVGGGRVLETISYTSFQGLQHGQVSKATITIENNEAENLDTTYYFFFTCEHPTPFSGSFRLVFPSDYSLPKTIDCSFSLDPTVCSVEDNSILVAAVPSPALTNFTVKLTHVTNPSTVGWTSDFAIESYDDMKVLIDANYHVPGVNIAQKTAKTQLQHVGIHLTPSNKNFIGDFSISFLPAVNVPRGTVIETHFPEDYIALPLQPECEATGTSIRSCASSGSVLSAVTDSLYVRGLRPAPITLTVKQLRSIDPPAKSSPVVLKLLYSGQLIDESPSSPVNRTLSFSSEPSAMSISSFAYTPTTASEEAVYSFTVAPTTEFTANCTFGVRFGQQFPRRLGQSLHCSSRELTRVNKAEQNDHVDCYETNRTVVFTNTRGWNRTDFPKFSVSIHGIVNPSAGTSIGPIAFFTQCGDAVVDFSVLGTAHTPDVPPMPMVLTGFERSDNGTGARANVTVAAALLQPLPPSAHQSLVYIDFPSDFDLDFVQGNVSCKSGFYRAMAGAPCQTDFGRVAISAFPPQFEKSESGRYEMVVERIENPWDAGEVLYPTLSVYDADRDIILCKTSQNLVNLPPLSYQKSLYNIEVNQNRPWVQNKGTQSNNITVTLETPAPKEFPISPKNEIPGVTVMPYSIYFEKGETQTNFQLSISQSAKKGNYTLEWNVNGAWGTQVYVARRFTIVIVDQGNEPVMISGVENAFQGGTSAEGTVWLQHAPANELILRLVKLSPQPTLLHFNPEVIRFAPGEKIKHFTIFIEDNSYGDMGEYFLYKEGVNANAYFLAKSVFSFKVIPREDSPPRIVQLEIHSISRTSAQYTAVTDKPATLYWLTANFGVRAPSVQEVKSSSFNASSFDPPLYASTGPGVEEMPAQYKHSLEVTALKALTRYIVFVLVDDEKAAIGGSWQRANYTTAAGFRSAYATVRFQRGSLQPSSASALLNKTASLLSVPAKRLKLLDFPRLNSTLPTTFANSTHFHLLLESDPYYSGTVSPAEALAGLKAHRDEIKAVCPSFDKTVELSPREIVAPPPVWKTKPVVGEKKSESVRLDGVLLASPGKIHMCIEHSDTPPAVPLSAQIALGLNSQYSKCLAVDSFRTTETESSVLITDLQKDWNYWVFLTADNDLPASADLMADAQVAILTFRTLLKDDTGPPRLRGKDNSSCFQLFPAVLLLILLS